ncbi:uncharacterized protein TNCV_680621 [Trichonephila clavipes]|nr:uncharacterized protein TNCV_680621 [Trichonephila clavipes]
MPSIGGYHPYGLASILTGLESIEHVWDMLGRRIAAHQPPSTCLPELRRALLDERCNIPQHQIDNLILSMPRRSRNPLRNGMTVLVERWDLKHFIGLVSFCCKETICQTSKLKSLQVHFP